MEGLGSAAIGKTFLLLSNAIGSERLAAEIDDDCDPSTPKVARRVAYTTMFRRGLRFWLDTQTRPFSADPPLPAMWNWGGPGNQGLDNMHSLYLQWLSLRWLDRSAAESELSSNAAKNLLMMGVGLSLSLQKGEDGSRITHG